MPPSTPDKTQFIQTGWTDTVRRKHSLTFKQIEVCADLHRPCAQRWFTPAMIYYGLNVHFSARSLDFLHCPFTFCNVSWLPAGGSDVWYFKFSRGWMFSWMFLLFLQMNSAEKCPEFRQHLQLAHLPYVKGHAPETFWGLQYLMR